jgi:tetratricopeptide (TPR) repeat protein
VCREFKEVVVVFDTFKKQMVKGTAVHLLLTTGKEVVGTVEEINDDHVVVNTNQGVVTVFEKLLGGWEKVTLEDQSDEEPESIHDSAAVKRINDFLGDFVKDKPIVARLKSKPPDYSFPLDMSPTGYKIVDETKQEWDRINNKYQHYLKIQNLAQIPSLARELCALGEKSPTKGLFSYNAGCFMSSLGKHSEALVYFERAFAAEKSPRYVYNAACSALEIGNYEKAHIALALYFTAVLPSSEIDAWQVFCSLTEKLHRYYALKGILDSVVSKTGNIGKNEDNENFSDFILLCKSIVYFLQENGKSEEAISIISSVDENNQHITAIHSIIDSCLESLPQMSCPEYEETAKSLRDEVYTIPQPASRRENIDTIPQPASRRENIDTIPQPASRRGKAQVARDSHLMGYIYKFGYQNFGFLHDLYGTNYFFHRSAITDEVLLNRLTDLSPGEEIPVDFEATRGPKGPVAIRISPYKEVDIRISSYKEVDEIFRSAVNVAEEGDYPRAIAQIKKVLQVSPDYPDAKDLYEKWREYARISVVPKGSNPYARARRAQLIEKDLEKAERLLREAIGQKDNEESAIKDLAMLLVQKGRTHEAIDVLVRNRNIIRSKQSVDNMLIPIYEKAGKYDQAIKLLRKKLYFTTAKEKKIGILFKIGNTHLRQENYKKVEEVFNAVLELDPENTIAKRNLAISLSKQERYNEAENILNQILDTSPNRIAAELLEAINWARETGKSDLVDEIIIETTLSGTSPSGEISKFARFFLNNCDFQGVVPEKIKENEQGGKEYNGSEREARSDIRKLEDIVKLVGMRRPRDRGNYYLSAARISHDVREDVSQFYRYLFRSFASRGDAAIVENRSPDVARTWYSESLTAYDGLRSPYGIEQDAVNALVRFLYSILGPTHVPTTPTIPSIDVTLDEVINRHPKKEKVFKMISYLVLHSRFAANTILNRLHKKVVLRNMALEYLRNMDVPVSGPIKRLDDFVSLWNVLLRKTLDEMRLVSEELHYLTNTELTTASLEDAIELVKDIDSHLFFDLDKQRTLDLQKILETALEYCKQNTFEEQERLLIQADNQCGSLMKEIEEGPTKLSIEEIDPVIDMIQGKVKERLEELYKTSMPQLTLRLPVESYTPDRNNEIEIQIVVENKMGRSPAESLELIVQGDEDEDFFTIKVPDIRSDESLRGGAQRIFKIPLRVTAQAIESQTFSLPVYAQYHSRGGEISQTLFENFSIRLYKLEEFEKIENPYSTYAEGNIVGDPEMFYGREELIQNIVSAVEKSRTQSKCIVVFGQKRSGKSSILFHLKKRFEKEKDLLVFDLGDIGAIMDEHSSVPFLYQILWGILSSFRRAIEKRVESGFSPLDLSFPGDIEFYEHPSPLILFKEIFDNYKHAASRLDDWHDIRIVMLIDEFSRIYERIIEGRIPGSFMKNWKALLQENYFHAVLAGQDVMPKFKQRFPNEFGTTQDERVSYLKPEDARKLIDEPIRIGGGVGQSRYRERAIERILELTAGSPFYIQILCNRLVEYMNRKHARLVTQADVEHIKEELIWGVNALSKDKFENLINSGDTSEDAISDEDSLNVLKAIAANSQTGPCNRSSITCETSTPLDTVLNDLVKRDVIERERECYYQIRVGLFREWLIINQ